MSTPPVRPGAPAFLDVAAVQCASGLEPAGNRALLEAHAPDDADLVVFPEAFARDFGPAGSDVAPFAEDADDGLFAAAVGEVAARRSATVVAGMFERGPDPERPFNTLVVRGPDGDRVARYRKVHLYDSFGYRESDRLTAGPLPRESGPTLVDVGGWSVGLMTCYDLRFPELARALVAEGAEALVLPAAWVAGERKVDHWRTLLRARAVENTVFVVAAAQPGPRYTGHSMVVDPRGDVLAEADDASTTVAAARLERDVLDDARRTNPSLANRRL